MNLLNLQEATKAMWLLSLGVPGLWVVEIFYESNYIYCLSFLSVGCLSHILRSWLSFFFIFFSSSEHRTNFPHFGSFSTKKEFFSIFRWFAKSFLHFWKKTTKIQHKNQRLACKVLKYHINSRNFWHIEFLAAKLV